MHYNRYICDGCSNRIDIGPRRCPLCGTIADGRRRLARRNYDREE